jgi:hypothetical protein
VSSTRAWLLVSIPGEYKPVLQHHGTCAPTRRSVSEPRVHPGGSVVKFVERRNGRYAAEAAATELRRQCWLPGYSLHGRT